MPKTVSRSKNAPRPRIGTAKPNVSPEQNRHEKSKKKHAPEKKSELGG